jgi:hypothetical protein
MFRIMRQVNSAVFALVVFKQPFFSVGVHFLMFPHEPHFGVTSRASFLFSQLWSAPPRISELATVTFVFGGVLVV